MDRQARLGTKLSAEDQNRTGDPSLFRGMLYQLSYLGLSQNFEHVVVGAEQRIHIWLYQVVGTECGGDDDDPVEDPEHAGDAVHPPYRTQDRVVILCELMCTFQ